MQMAALANEGHDGGTHLTWTQFVGQMKINFSTYQICSLIGPAYDVELPSGIHRTLGLIGGLVNLDWFQVTVSVSGRCGGLANRTKSPSLAQRDRSKSRPCPPLPNDAA